jgi:hypothetical protein
MSLLGLMGFSDMANGRYRNQNSFSPSCHSSYQESPVPPPVDLSSLRYRIVEVTEYEEKGPTEKRKIDVSRSRSSQKRTVEFTQEWTSSIALKTQQVSSSYIKSGFSSSESTGYKFGSEPFLVDFSESDKKLIESSSRQTITSTYQIQENRTYGRKESVTVDVPPQTETELFIHWKKTWVKGTIEFSNNKVKGYIPFEALVGLAFDTKQIDTLKQKRFLW